MIWANLIHLGYNMWEDRFGPKFTQMSDHLRCDEKLWHDITDKMAEIGMNMVIIDLGEGVQYKSHPELAVKGSWSIKKLKTELKKLRDKGLTPIPKLNFSATHDAWLGEYSRQLSTPIYYQVCKDLIDEMVDAFDGPEFFHLGYDEEQYELQRWQQIVIIRQFELWWHDFLFFVDTVEKLGSRPWIWSDFIRNHKDQFLEKMPKSVLQSSWYYNKVFEPVPYKRGFAERKSWLFDFRTLDKNGYDQVPTGSNWGYRNNFPDIVKYCKKNVRKKHLKGFMQTPWLPTLEEFRDKHMEAIDAVKDGMAIFNSFPSS